MYPNFDMFIAATDEIRLGLEERGTKVEEILKNFERFRREDRDKREESLGLMKYGELKSPQIDNYFWRAT